MFSKYEQRGFIKIQIERSKNARQCHTALLVAWGREPIPYHTVVWWAYAFRRGKEDVHQCHTSIISVEQSVRRLVQQDTVDGIRRLLVVWIRFIHVEGDYFCSLKHCNSSKNVFFVLNSNVGTNWRCEMQNHTSSSLTENR